MEKKRKPERHSKMYVLLAKDYHRSRKWLTSVLKYLRLLRSVFFKPLYNHHPHRNSLCLQNCREWESLSRLNRSGRNSFQKYLNLCSALSARIKARHVCGSIKPAPACGPVNAAAAAGDVAAGAG